MLKVHNHPSNFTAQAPALSSTQDEDDELIKAIDSDHKDADNEWQLTNEPDSEGIDAFWNGVVSDLQKDPDWYSFSND